MRIHNSIWIVCFVLFFSLLSPSFVHASSVQAEDALPLEAHIIRLVSPTSLSEPTPKVTEHVQKVLPFSCVTSPLLLVSDANGIPVLHVSYRKANFLAFRFSDSAG